MFGIRNDSPLILFDLSEQWVCEVHIENQKADIRGALFDKICFN